MSNYLLLAEKWTNSLQGRREIMRTACSRLSGGKFAMMIISSSVSFHQKKTANSVLFDLFNKAFKRGNSAEQARTTTDKNLPELKDKSKDYFEKLRFNSGLLICE